MPDEGRVVQNGFSDWLTYETLSQFLEKIGVENILNFLGLINKIVTQIILFILGNFFTFILISVDVIFQACVYLALVQYFMSKDSTFVNVSLKSLGIRSQARRGIINNIEKLVRGIYFANLSGALMQAAYTWLIFDFMDVKCIYLYALAAAFFRIVPHLSTILIALIGAFQLYYQTEGDSNFAIIMTMFF